MKLGLQGVTVLVASGDDGVSGRSTRGNPAACGFAPQFPASSPHVTAVGATQGPESGTPEVVCEADTAITNPPLITSGGGFSGVFAQPPWQAAAVAAYLRSGVQLPPAGSYATAGRAYPDVSAMGHSYPVVMAGSLYPVDGTSASAPTFSAIVAQLNAQRAAAGQPPLGFLNPALYSLNQTTNAFRDITEGGNRCGAVYSGTLYTCCPNGFLAFSGTCRRRPCMCPVTLTVRVRNKHVCRVGSGDWPGLSRICPTERATWGTEAARSPGWHLLGHHWCALGGRLEVFVVSNCSV